MTRGLRHGAITLIVRLFAAVLSCLPRGVVMALARVAGTVAYAACRRERRIAMANLDIVFGETKTRQEKRRIARGAFVQFAKTIFGLLWAPRLNASSIDQWAYLSAESEAHFKRARASGRGFILNVPHYGDWEMASLAMGYWGYPYMGVGSDEENSGSAVHSFLQRLRMSSGHVVIPPRNAMLKLFKQLKRGGSIAMLADVNIPRSRGGIWVDFMGLGVFTTHAAAELALRSGAMIVFGYVRPLPDGRPELVIDGEIEPSRTGDHEADVRITTQRLADRVAALIRAHPEPWLWTYRRWRRRPTRERGRYPFYSKYSEPTAAAAELRRPRAAQQDPGPPRAPQQSSSSDHVPGLSETEAIA